MSRAAIQEVLKELEGLPESDQELVLGFLRALKRQHGTTPAPVADGRGNPALELENGRLVFTGKLEAPDIDWVRVVREERDEEFIRQALGPAEEP
ncbi:MAG TPA: hypothetical protein VN829_23345 [Dongiaceae bacterium]|nr:hypothetical protein [Dongiaceae bacterium]